MAKWKYKLDLKDLWKKAEAREITAKQLADGVAERIQKLSCYKSSAELHSIVDDINFLAEDCDFDDWDEVYSRLCDWGDTTVLPGWPGTKLCWVGTII